MNPIKEAEFQKRITDMATRFGWTWRHVPAPMVKRGDHWVGAKQAAGLPDLLLVHDNPPRLILAEIKGDGGKLSDDQRDLLAALRNVADYSGWVGRTPIPRTLGVYAWFPEDEPTIEQILRTRILI